MVTYEIIFLEENICRCHVIELPSLSLSQHHVSKLQPCHCRGNTCILAAMQISNQTVKQIRSQVTSTQYQVEVII